MNNNALLTILIPTWNRCDSVKSLIDSSGVIDNPLVEFIIVDNASDSPSAIGAILGERLEKGNFSGKIRNRCYQLRFMRALVNAYDSKMIIRGKQDAQLCMLLVRLYYLAAKMKMKDSDLQGPFVKLS